MVSGAERKTFDLDYKLVESEVREIWPNGGCLANSSVICD